MPVCESCCPEHTAAECVDTLAGRTGTARHCVCQHRPRPAQPPEPTEARAAAEAGEGQG